MPKKSKKPKKAQSPKKHAFKKSNAVRLALKIVIAYYVVMFFLSFVFVGCLQTMGNPCFTKISKENCYIGTKGEITPQTKIATGISGFSDAVCGGSCEWRVSQTNSIVLPFNGGIKIERENNNLKITPLKQNAKSSVIGTGQKWVYSSNAFSIDPWIIKEEKIELENTATINCVGRKKRAIYLFEKEYDFLLVNGTRKIHAKPSLLGIASFFVFLLVLVWLDLPNLKGKKLKELFKSTKFKITALMCLGVSLFVASTVL